MNIPQPFQYQGSKRNLAPTILKFFPQKAARLIEPFAGSGALSLSCATRGRCEKYWLNDINKPLIELLNLIVTRPSEVAEFYDGIWCDKDQDHIERFFSAREKFNKSGDPMVLLYLLARCVKGAVRYNRDGHFNQSPDKRRVGTHPKRMRENIFAVSRILQNRTQFSFSDYREVIGLANASDIIYMDPPYQGVCSTRDQRYASGISFNGFVEALDQLNRKGRRYLVSYDGRVGEKTYGYELPEDLDLVHLEIDAGRSAQATLLGHDATTVESLYISRNLADEVGVSATYIKRQQIEQFRLLEEGVKYERAS